jgi:hypothetical protein
MTFSQSGIVTILVLAILWKTSMLFKGARIPNSEIVEIETNFDDKHHQMSLAQMLWLHMYFFSILN